MPRILTFDGRRVVEAGAYATTRGASEEAPTAGSSGKVLVIDTGLGAGFGGGSGVTGEKYQNTKSIYEFDNLTAFQDWNRGGWLWDIARKLFKPSKNPTVNGVQSLFYIKAATTTAASAILTFVSTSVLTVKTVSEGVGANGVNVSSVLKRGFSVKLVAGTDDTTKYMLEFYVGTHKGDRTYAGVTVAYDGISEADAAPQLLMRSIETTSAAELKTWMETDFLFSQYFYLSSSTISVTPTIVAGDLVTLGTPTLFSGATETYSSLALDAALEAVRETDYTFILCDAYGVVNGKGTNNTKIWAHILTAAVYQKIAYIGGGTDSTQYDQATSSSFNVGAYFNDSHIHVVHGDYLQAKASGGFYTLPSIYKAATILGRTAGNAPQVPTTWKDIDIDGEVHVLTLRQREKGLLNGVMHTKLVRGTWVVNQDINTKLKNTELIYPDGSSPEGSIMRISSLLNKELKQNLEERFIGNNVNNASPADIKSFVEGYLASRTATKGTDNLILSSKNVKVELCGTDYNVRYEFMPNGPVNRIMLTGFMLNINLTA